MLTNIVEVIQAKLGYPPLKKVDPNSQEIKEGSELTPDQKLSQAAVPAVLAGMLKYSDGPDGVKLLSDNENMDWLQTVYAEREKDVVQKVAEYASVGADRAETEMKKISNEAVNVVRENVKTPDAEKLRVFMNSQRHNILSHLPASMQIGDVLHEDTFDDRTNKMEGPVSSFIHKIEDIL
jgi:hypothetical protein